MLLCYGKEKTQHSHHSNRRQTLPTWQQSQSVTIQFKLCAACPKLHPTAYCTATTHIHGTLRLHGQKTACATLHTQTQHEHQSVVGWTNPINHTPQHILQQRLRWVRCLPPPPVHHHVRRFRAFRLLPPHRTPAPRTMAPMELPARPRAGQHGPVPRHSRSPLRGRCGVRLGVCCMMRVRLAAGRGGSV